MTTLDCRAKKCPHPVVETRKLVLERPGVPLRVLVGDDTARENVSRLAASQGYTVEASDTDGGFALELTPGAASGKTGDATGVVGKTVAFVASDAMGNGDDELGRLLMKNFLFTLT